MKRKGTTIFIFFIMVFSLYCLPGASAAEVFSPYNQPYVSADAAILMDIKTGQVLYAKNPFKKRPPASTTKVMTALLALETANLSEKVIVSKEAERTEGSSMYLRAGQILPMSDLLYGALLNSGNDACEAIAEHIGGSIQNFAVLMNVKALAIGALQTHFANPHGLPDENHYTTAFDLALIARKALLNKNFANIVSTRQKTVDMPGEDWDRRLVNTNQLLWKYPWAEGVKTGTTSAAGPCLISAAVKDSRKLLAVVLYSGNRWSDSIELFEYGFNRYEHKQVAVAGKEFGTIRIACGSQENLPVAYAGDLSILVPGNDPKAVETRVSMESYPTAPIKKGQVIGSVSYLVNKTMAGRVDLVSAVEVGPEGNWIKLVKWLKRQFYNIIGQNST